MKSLKVLVVDDEPGIRQLMADALSAQGHAAMCAKNGVEAVASLAVLSVDVVFLDIRMPRGDGLVALAKIKRLWPGLPVVMITGGGRHDEIEQGFRLGANACILKPFSLRELAETMESLASEAQEAA